MPDKRKHLKRPKKRLVIPNCSDQEPHDVDTPAEVAAPSEEQGEQSCDSEITHLPKKHSSKLSLLASQSATVRVSGR